MLCSALNCNQQAHARGFCNTHYRRVLANGSADDAAMRRAPNGDGWIAKGYAMVMDNGERRPVHVLIAERAIGRRLRKDQPVHHANRIKLDNRPTNLVVCQDEAYHALLHRRIRALEQCGHADWRSCQFCKKFDDPSNLVPRKSSHYHKHCAAAYERNRSQLRHQEEPHG